MVPIVELPPATPFTVQVTLGSRAPVTVAVNACGLPVRTMAVAGATTTATPPLTTMFTPVETLAPGSGLCTVIICVPACAVVAVPAAVSCVDETYAVMSAVVPMYATAVGAKCEPFSVNRNGPGGMLKGDTLVNCGSGLFSVALALPSFLTSDVSTAVMVMEFGAGGNSGAVYIPLASIVPSVAFPPAIPLIDQLTAGFEPSPVFAVNFCCATPGMAALDGVTVNAVSPGPPPAPGSPGRIAWAHPLSNTAATRITSAKCLTIPPSEFPIVGSTPHAHQSRGAFQIAVYLVEEEYKTRNTDTTGLRGRFGATVLASRYSSERTVVYGAVKTCRDMRAAWGFQLFFCRTPPRALAKSHFSFCDAAIAAGGDGYSSPAQRYTSCWPPSMS